MADRAANRRPDCGESCPRCPLKKIVAVVAETAILGPITTRTCVAQDRPKVGQDLTGKLPGQLVRAKHE